MPHEPQDGESTPDRDLARYSRQMLCEQVGEEGQRRLRRASVTLVGCGALGGVLANTLVRAGVGSLRIIDRDFIELSNLQRHPLFDEHDIAQNLPKAEAAARKLHKINSAVEIEAVVADVNPGNAEAYCSQADLILDGTDNMETRFLVNDVAVKHNLPWVYGACIGTEGLVMPILPRQTPCLRCVWDRPPPPGTIPTCDTVGVLAAVVNVVASLQATEAMKILMGHTTELNGLLAVDVWTGRIRAINVQPAYDDGDCPCCKHGQYEFLEVGCPPTATRLGRGAVHLLPVEAAELDFKRIAGRLPGTARAKFSEYMLTFSADQLTVTVFRDGRAIVQGTTDPAIARGVLAKYLGA